ncbi:YjgN family protein [Psychrobacter sp. PAMC 21119]|uniref:YjgN family protein n=1 Tax=Psychrobacter sp. PAMC 21119 TaxID=1112209 RepID=UPI000287A447|nr:YjgN family protein [Psychrobacter sp. PAMC 21119]
MKQIQFKGDGSEYFKIWIVNVLLCIVTIGIYYPWAKVRTRRYFYANTEYADRYFDYHATGKQLFLGYLIGVFILFALQIVGSMLPTIGLILPIVLFAFIPWIIMRSLKFNMRMTSFSNVRFSFKGNLKPAYIIYMLIPILGYLAIALPVFVSLFPMSRLDEGFNVIFAFMLFLVGIIAAIAIGVFVIGLFTKKAAEYQIGQTKFGQGDFFINVNTSKFIKIQLKKILIIIGCLIILSILSGLIFAATISGGFDLGSISNDIESAEASPLFIVGFLVVYFGFIATFLFATAYSFSRQRQYIFENTTLDKAITFRSTVGAKRYFYILVTNMLLVLFTAGLALPWAKVRVARYIADNSWIEASDIDINSYLTQKEKEQSAIGEEIGDVLDIDIDIAI